MKKLHKIKELLDSIFDEKIKNKAIENTIIQKGFNFLDEETTTTDLKVLIPRCFDFQKTKEGLDYWVEKVKEM